MTGYIKKWTHRRQNQTLCKLMLIQNVCIDSPSTARGIRVSRRRHVLSTLRSTYSRHHPCPSGIQSASKTLSGDTHTCVASCPVIVLNVAEE